jgi:hypothetical protein
MNCLFYTQESLKAAMRITGCITKNGRKYLVASAKSAFNILIVVEMISEIHDPHNFFSNFFI